MPSYEQLRESIEIDVALDQGRTRRFYGWEFEQRLHQLISSKLPFSVLPNVTMFRPDHFRADDPERTRFAYELDNIFHYRRDEIDHLIIIDAKAQPILVDGNGQWTVRHPGRNGRPPEIFDVRRKLQNQAEAVLRYLHPLDNRIELRIVALAISYSPDQVLLQSQISPQISVGVISYRGVTSYLEGLLKPTQHSSPQVLRASQSEFLSLLRMGVKVPSLGHPEPQHAIRYVNRCRRELDFQLYKSFSPSRHRWVINGTAGMGKSILLAYALAVFSSGYRVKVRNDTPSLEEFSFDDSGMVPRENRIIHVYAMKPKQLQVLEQSYLRFVQELIAIGDGQDFPFLKPEFSVWSDSKPIPLGCNLLVLDESHDLSSVGQARLREWHESNEGRNYLLMACDHHQKMIQHGGDAVMLEGVSFQGHSTRLNKNYRNPFPVYASALALLCRWFSKEGPQIRPTQRQLKDLLGFEYEPGAGPDGISNLMMRNDLHPANSWSHCVEQFPSASAAYEHLAQQNLQRGDVLWIRMCTEDTDFDYEKLAAFTYHNCFTPEGSELVDKYVKGQEFPVVVIEGLSSEFDAFDNEEDMWRLRRMLYICCSRANVFLYFVTNSPETSPEISRLKSEVSTVVKSFSQPIDPLNNIGTTWEFSIQWREGSRPFKDFGNSDPIIDNDRQDEAAQVIQIHSPIVVKQFADKLGIKPFEVIKELMGMSVFASIHQTIDHDVASKIAEKHGFKLSVLEA